MPSQFSLLNRKVLISASDYTWISEPMYWGGFQRCEAYLAIYSLGDQGTPLASLTFEGSNEPGQNAAWTSIAAGSPSDPSTTASAPSVKRYVRNATLYPYVRVKVVLSALSGVRVADVSVDGTLFEVASA